MPAFFSLPAHPLDVLLGRPTATSATVRVLALANREGVISDMHTTCAPDKVTADFVRSCLPADETADHKYRAIAFSNSIPSQ